MASSLTTEEHILIHKVLEHYCTMQLQNKNINNISWMRSQPHNFACQSTIRLNSVQNKWGRSICDRKQMCSVPFHIEITKKWNQAMLSHYKDSINAGTIQSSYKEWAHCWGWCLQLSEGLGPLLGPGQAITEPRANWAVCMSLYVISKKSYYLTVTTKGYLKITVRTAVSCTIRFILFFQL